MYWVNAARPRQIARQISYRLIDDVLGKSSNPRIARQISYRLIDDVLGKSSKATPELLAKLSVGPIDDVLRKCNKATPELLYPPSTPPPPPPPPSHSLLHTTKNCKTMSCNHLSYTAMTGKPIVRDCVLHKIISGGNLSIFANIGAFKEHHLRVLVNMPRTPLYVIKMVAREPGTHPEKAIDYCSSAAMARVLIKICDDVSCFSFYNQPAFVEGMMLHDYRKGADRFRRKEIVYEVLCERVLHGGDVLPPHVAKWFVNYGGNMLYAYVLKRKSDHMMACYDLYEKQAFEINEEIVTPVSYEFMIAYHRYTKYLPLTMFARAVFRRRRNAEKSVRDMIDQGYTCDQIQSDVAAQDITEMAELKMSSGNQKKKRRFARVMVLFPSSQLFEVVQRMFEQGCCEKKIMSFL